MLVMIDLDNTLADRAAAVDRWVANFVAERQLRPDDAVWINELDNDGYSSRLEVLTAIASRFGLPEPVDDLLAAYQADIIGLTRPVQGASTCLEEMRTLGWTIAIVTNGSTKQQNAKIDQLGFRQLVDAVVVSETLGIKKPEAGIFHQAAAHCGVRLGISGQPTAWMVGDSPLHDIEGAQRLGLSTAWVPRGRSWRVSRPAPTVVVTDLETLPSQLAAAS